MLDCFASSRNKPVPIELVVHTQFNGWLSKQSQFVKKWLASSGFRAQAGSYALIPDATGKINQVLCCMSDDKNFWSIGQLPYSLPEGNYELSAKYKNNSQFYMAWGLGAYQFTDYKKPTRKPAKLFIPSSHVKAVESLVSSIYWVRDLINTPADDMGPTEFGKAILKFSKHYKLSHKQVVGEDLLKKNFPCIHIVGRASDDPPRLLDLRWGNKKHPKVTLVGKGVCFDSGGLDIKPSSNMLLMKKDMGGAAHVLGLARMIIDAKLPICLRLLIPVVENVISANAYRPGDIVRSRKGITVEIGNTDSEGRVILSDAIFEAASEKPDLLIDISTLTGAARVALGTELPAMFCNQDKLANDILTHANNEQDYVWRMPLFTLYRESLNSTIADINNNSSDSYGGAITAALFLKEFVPDEIPWVHFDLMAWNLKARPGRPQGGEAMGLRALFSYLKAQFN